MLLFRGGGNSRHKGLPLFYIKGHLLPHDPVQTAPRRSLPNVPANLPFPVRIPTSNCGSLKCLRHQVLIIDLKTGETCEHESNVWSLLNVVCISKLVLGIETFNWHGLKSNIPFVFGVDTVKVETCFTLRG